MKKKYSALLIIATLGFSFATITQFANLDNLNPVEAAYFNPISGAEFYNDPQLYYQGIDPSLTGEELMSALAKLNDTGRVGKSYKSLPEIYQYSDVTENGKMRLAYTGTEKSFSPGSMPGSCNKEHVWAASWYGPNGKRQEDPGTPGADAHNVWPCATSLNSKRGSCAFDEIPQNESSSFKCYEFNTNDFAYGNDGDPDSWVWSTADGKSNGNAQDCLYPAKGHRGETARCMLYVATSYHLHKDVTPVLYDQPQFNSNGKCGRLSTLLKWHFQEPPTAWEIKRNQEVATRWHHNRNPFIDHPEYAAQIYAFLPEPGQSKPTQRVLDVINTYGNMNFEDPTGITIANKNISIAKGEEYKIKAKILPEGARQSFVFSSNNPLVASVDAYGKITANKAGNCQISVKAKENEKIFDIVNVSVKEVSKIELSGEPNCKNYFAGEIFKPLGLVVTATFNDGTSEVIPNESCRWLDNMTGQAKLSVGSTAIKCIYADKFAVYQGINVIKKETTGYYRVNEKLDDYSGDYLIVDEESSVMLDGDARDYNKSNKDIQTSVTIKNDVIEGDFADKDFTITKSGNGYKIISSSQKTIGSTSSSGLDSGNYINEISFDKFDPLIMCGKYTLRYNAGYFRYYSNSAVGNPVSLYKSDGGPSMPDEGESDEEALISAREYAIQFNQANVCGTNDNTKAISELFLKQKDNYFKLSIKARNILTNGSANQNDINPIQQCLARYDRIIYLHSNESNLYPDFMNRLGTPQFKGSESSNASITYDDSSLSIVLIASGLTILSVCGVFIARYYFKKSKLK